MDFSSPACNFFGVRRLVVLQGPVQVHVGRLTSTPPTIIDNSSASGKDWHHDAVMLPVPSPRCPQRTRRRLARPEGGPNVLA